MISFTEYFNKKSQNFDKESYVKGITPELKNINEKAVKTKLAEYGKNIREVYNNPKFISDVKNAIEEFNALKNKLKANLPKQESILTDYDGDKFLHENLYDHFIKPIVDKVKLMGSEDGFQGAFLGACLLIALPILVTLITPALSKGGIGVWAICSFWYHCFVLIEHNIIKPLIEDKF